MTRCAYPAPTPSTPDALPAPPPGWSEWRRPGGRGPAQSERGTYVVWYVGGWFLPYRREGNVRHLLTRLSCRTAAEAFGACEEDGRG